MNSNSEFRATEPQAVTSGHPKGWLSGLPKSLPWGAIGFLGVMAVALAVRVVRLDSVPANLTADEFGFIRLGWHILAGTGPGFFGFDDTPSPALGIYLIAGTMKLFGDGIIGGRTCPVLLSMGTLIAFFLLARERLSYLASLLAALLLATNVWFLHFSRTTWTNMNADLFAVAGALMLALALRKERWYYYAGAGVFAALGLYGYFSGRLLLFFFLAYLPFALFVHRDRARQILQGYAILVATCFLVFLPQIKPVVDNWDSFNRRPAAMSIFKVDTPYYGEASMGRIIVRQVVWAARGFILIDHDSVMNHGNYWPRYIPPGRGLLDAFARWLFLLGLVAAAWKWRQTALWWVMFLAPVLTIQVFSGGTPDAARGLIVAPFMFLFVGQGIDLLLGAGHWIGARVRGTSIGVAVALTGVAALFAEADVHEYFDWMNTPFALNARGPALAGKEFLLWKSLEQEAAREGRSTFDFPQWCRLQYENGTTDAVVGNLCNDTAPEQDPRCAETSAKSALERDEQRLSDIDDISAALKKYHDKYGLYPSTADQMQPLCIYPQRGAGCKLREFLQPLPREPRSSSTCFGYSYRCASDGQSFTLYAVMETGSMGGWLCASVPPQFAGVQHLYCANGP